MSSLPTSITFNVLNSHSSHFSIFSWKHLFHKCQAIISSQHVLICLITTSSGRQLHLTVCHLRCSNRVSTYGSVHRFQKSFTTDWTRWYQEEVFVSYGCHPRGMDAVAHPSNKLLGVKTLMIESSLGFTPIGGSFIKLDTSLQTVRNSCTDSPWLLTEKWMEHFASLVNDSTAFLYQGVSAGPNAQVDPIILCGASRSVMTSNQSIFFQASLSSLDLRTHKLRTSVTVNFLRPYTDTCICKSAESHQEIACVISKHCLDVYGPPCQVCEHNTIIMLWHWCIFGLLSSYHIMEPNKSSMAWLNAVLLPAVVPSAAPESLRRTTCTADSSFSLILLCSHVVPSSAF